MNNWTLIIASFLLLSSAFAEPDENVVKEMARQTHISQDEIRANYNGCDSGVTLYMKICGSYRWMVEDVRLNKVYKSALNDAKNLGYESNLIQAQKSWLA